MGGRDPVGDRLMVAPEGSPDPSEAVTFEIKLERSFSRFIVIAERVRAWRVLATAGLALEALAARSVEARFNLPLGAAATRTLLYVKRYSILGADLGNASRGLFF